MDRNKKFDASAYLQTLVGQPLCYGIKSPDMDLYDFGFGKPVEVISQFGGKMEICTHILHAVCRFQVIWKNGESRVDRYYEDTPSGVFHSAVKRLLGLRVRSVTLSSKNDLWLDFGDYWIVFITFENEEESWRFFTANKDMPHLVASASNLQLDF